MAQVTLYLDDKTLRKIERAAKSANSSISRWVKQKIEQALNDSWPPGYFDLCGKLKTEALKRPRQPVWKNDSLREKW